MNILHWTYLHGKPNCKGSLKSQPEDFMVSEKLGYSPCGEGEHIYLWIRKSGLNTAFVAEQLAKFTGLPLRAISYAGRKDKFAVTEQWFGVHKPGKQEYDWQNFSLSGAEVLSSKRHNKKLRTGVLKGNSFKLVVRDISQPQDLAERLSLISKFGVPNYFGEQRFGNSHHFPQGGNLALAQKMIEGETINNRNKRSMAISALRAWLFNEFVHHRIQRFQQQVCKGDVLQLAGSKSFFNVEEIDDTINQRIASRDVLISSPMWGEGELDSQSEAGLFEREISNLYPDQTRTLADLGLKQERRASFLFPDHIDWQLENDIFTVSFDLPAGAYATSVMRELIDTTEPGQSI